MPNIDGIQACENLRSDEKFNETIIMFLTARGEEYSHLAAYKNSLLVQKIILKE